MSITQLLFWFLTALALGSALMVIFSKNPVHSILWLITTFFSISGHYILLNAQFLAIVNIIVYAGAIMVLFLFVVMLMNLNASATPLKEMAAVCRGNIELRVAYINGGANAGNAPGLMMKTGEIGLIHNLGMVLFKDYVLPSK